MEHSFEKYYLDRPLRSLVDELSNRRLDVEKHREQVNGIVMSLVIQYLGEYLKVPSRDPREIGKVSRRKKEEMKAKRTRENSAQRMIIGAMQGDPDAGKSRDDAPGLDCLMDTATTAALFKELVFTERFEKNGQFVGADFGSGTGILTLATAIAGRRSGAQRPFTIGLDREETSVKRSTELLSRLVMPQEVLMQAVDVRSPGLISALFQGLPISLWVSETISDLTPAMRITDGRLVYASCDDHALVVQVLNSAIEPYFEVLANTLTERPTFEKEVRMGRTAMFPNLVNGDYVPDEKKGGTLKLRSSPLPNKASPLSRLSFEFTSYEQPVPESIHDPRWLRFPPLDML